MIFEPVITNLICACTIVKLFLSLKSSERGVPCLVPPLITIATPQYQGIMNQFSPSCVSYEVSKLAALAQALITIDSPLAYEPNRVSLWNSGHFQCLPNPALGS